MKFSVAVLPALLAPSTARSIFGGDAQKAITHNDDLKIPGESPLEHCPDRKSEGFIEINSVDLVPNPPAAGKELVIKANGTVKKTIEEGAYIDLVVKYGLIRLLKTRADLCEQMGEVDLKCPVEPGDRVITKTVELPKEIPPGTYNVEADVFTRDGERITCLTASVKFNLPGMDFLGGEL
ncbi:phosphatidylglycerol/phosphatidylinositol transfer protein precursor [Pochonia chlamydosporia 170]|uniref:Phosphatidylglycerol/phosphatidylinositol transfer protein n=1 Tax=Pochonia chlamydosporia 170 TaxID=1380566 RepID=A0A179F2X1_METCM|nr:phosphatidylglycerol/phosphatidylinositol transfer protein precursor [Pochonia chlamydosporia 170]OAQ59711.1 phosphatidylglycerol/phosphatidylinositol transfer protein precursor [Pochonia chlamydosporia 170]